MEPLILYSQNFCSNLKRDNSVNAADRDIYRNDVTHKLQLDLRKQKLNRTNLANLKQKKHQIPWSNRHAGLHIT